MKLKRLLVWQKLVLLGGVFMLPLFVTTYRIIASANEIGIGYVYSTLLWVALGILLVSVVGFLMMRDITVPLARAVSVAEQIAAGDLSAAVDEEDRIDEIGTLNVSFSRMIRSLQEMARVAERLAAGDLTVAVRPQSARDVMGNAFATMVLTLRGQAQAVTEGVHALSASTEQILAAVTRVVSGATETASAVSQAATTVEEVKQTTQVSSQRSQSVSESAHQAVQIAQAGEKSVEDAVGGMNRVRGQMDSIADSVVKLGEQSRAIGEIIAAVNDLAEQSNLLAVNAAIEAAKAGEHGKGFAVVAQEVKSLAEQSKRATAQVRTLLSDIQKASNVAVMVTEQGTKSAELGVKQSIEAGESIRTLARTFSDAAQSVSQISASAQQQLIGMDQVAAAMENIKAASSQNVETMQQIESTVQNLSEVGAKLQGLMARYTLENGRKTAG